MWEPITYSPEYLEDILEMTRENYGPDNNIAQKDFIEHQYFQNPAGDAVIDLALDREKKCLAGQYTVCPMRFWIDSAQRLCSNSLNTLTREAYRGQGIFTGLAKRIYEREADIGHGFCYGIPNPNSYPGFIKKLSFREIGQTPLYLRPLKPSTMVREFMGSKGLSILAKPCNMIWGAKSVKKVAGLEFVRITEDNLDIVNRFWETVRGKYPIMNIRDSAFIRFRYLNMPKRKYWPYMAILNGKPVAFAVGRIMTVAGMQCGMLADFLFCDGYEKQAKVLTSFMLRLLQTNGASVAGSLMLNHTKEAALLRKCGFWRCPKKLEPQPFPLIIRLFDQSLETKGILDIHNWFFTMGDYDVI